MSTFEYGYLELVDDVLDLGVGRNTRAGKTRSLFGTKLVIPDLAIGRFPILTTRKIYYKPVFGELAAFIRGATDLATFQQYGCNYWNANADAWKFNEDVDPKNKRVGQIYGAKWRNWHGHDQLTTLVRGIRQDPDGRRHLLTTYDPGETDHCLPPCHLLAQFNCDPSGSLDCVVYMRSVDLCLGLPADIILYAALLLLICKETSRVPGQLTFMMGDTHIYENHIPIWDQQREQIMHQQPKWLLQPDTSLWTFVPENLELFDYQHSGKIDYAFNV